MSLIILCPLAYLFVIKLKVFDKIMKQQGYIYVLFQNKAVDEQIAGPRERHITNFTTAAKAWGGWVHSQLTLGNEWETSGLAQRRQKHLCFAGFTPSLLALR